MKSYRIVIVHKRKPVAESLQWCFELFESDEIIIQTKLAANEVAELAADILLIDVDNFLLFSEMDVYPPCQVLLLAEQIQGEKIMDALFAGASSVADLTNGPEGVIDKTRQILHGQTDDAHSLIKMFVKDNAGLHSTKQSVEIEYGLTNKEKEVLKAMREGLHLKLIAYNTGTSYDTVRTHVKHIYKKIGVMSASEAVIKAMKMNL